jgi:hypothetical protein
VGYAYEDEKVLGLMKQLESKLGYINEVPRGLEKKAQAYEAKQLN